MDVILTSSASSFTKINPARFSAKPSKNPSQISPSFVSFPVTSIQKSSLSSPFSCSCSSSTSSATSLPLAPIPSNSIGSETQQRYWMVLMENPPKEISSRPQIINYYVKTLEKALGRWVLFLFNVRMDYAIESCFYWILWYKISISDHVQIPNI